jgi:hypothetical protein
MRELGSRKGRNVASYQCLYPQAAGTEEELEQAQWVLAKARGDLEEAVQMLVEGKEDGPPGWDGPNQVCSHSLIGSTMVYLGVSPHPSL